MSQRIFYLVLTDNGPLQNPNRDTSAVKAELSADAEKYNDPTDWVVTSGRKSRHTIESGENPMKDFSKKYYFDDERVAMGVANDWAMKNPNRFVYVAKTITALRSEVKEPEQWPLAS